MHIVTRILSSGTSLDYAVDTSPFPLQASPMDTSKLLTTATLTLIASNPKSTQVNLSSVELAFDIAPSDDADDGTYLTSIGSGIGFVAYGDPEQKLWTCTNDGAGNLAATAKAGSVPITGQGLGLIVSNIQPNRGIGTFQLTITETVTGKGAAETVIEISKFPYEFFLTNLRADADQVAEGHGTTLRWDGGVGATLTIFHGGKSCDVTGKNCWPTGNLTQDTEFTLQASIDHVAISTWNMTVQVSEPILTLTSLTVNQGSTLTGPVSAGSTLAVTGGLTARDGANVTGDLAATGAVSGASLALGGWSFTVDSSNALHLTSPTGAVVTFDTSGNLTLPAGLECQAQIAAAGNITAQGTIAATGAITTNGSQVVSVGNTIRLQNDQGYLNGTTKRGGPGSGWHAAAYWQNYDTPDGDSNLHITIVP